MPDVAKWLPDTAIFVAIVTAATGLYWNFHSAKAGRKLPFLQRQLDHCFEAVEVVSILATTSDTDLWQRSRDRFWQIYYGVLAVVEGLEVEGCMVACSNLIPPVGTPPMLPNSGLCDPALKLSQSVRRLLISAWDIGDLEGTLAGKSGVFETVRQAYVTEFDKQMSKGKVEGEAVVTHAKTSKLSPP